MKTPAEAVIATAAKSAIEDAILELAQVAADIDDGYYGEAFDGTVAVVQSLMDCIGSEVRAQAHQEAARRRKESTP